MKTSLFSFGFALFATSAFAAEAPAGAMSASELAGRLSAQRQDGTSYVRMRMEVKGGTAPTTLQVQMKARRGKGTSEAVYQILFPKERKGEAALLRKSGGSFSGTVFNPAGGAKSLDASQMKEGLFGTDLSYEDAIDNFFAWDRHALVGTETVDRVPCQILESKPGKGDRSSYSSVRTWVDTKRMIPMRIEKYGSSGQPMRRIDTTNVASDDNHRPIPANLVVRGGRRDSVTEIDGSKIRHDVSVTDRDFTPEGMKELTAPRAE